MKGDISKYEYCLETFGFPNGYDICFSLMENYNETTPKENSGTSGRKRNIVLAGKTYTINFSFVIPEKLLEPVKVQSACSPSCAKKPIDSLVNCSKSVIYIQQNRV